ncbi:hypothetical protein ACX93W_00075 [Paenibacillus sp. CAU 1782]
MFPNMLDQYQIGLTRMLEAEQYKEAKELLSFLLQCQGQEKRHYEEWENLLRWLEMAFPDETGARGEASPDELDEEEMRTQLLQPPAQDEEYIKQVLYIMQHHPMLDQQLLALERAVYIQDSSIETYILEWLQSEDLHPILQFKALQALRKRGSDGSVTLQRMGEEVNLEIGSTPLSLEHFPDPVGRILERTEMVVEADDPTLPHFARELWKESLQYLYGTSAYRWMLREDEDIVDCYAAALHLTLLLTVYGSANDDDVREAYGITDNLRFRYEQACRTLRSIAMLLQSGDDEHQP